MRDFVVLGGKKTKPIQTQTKPILFSPQIFWGLKNRLKKQTQFQNGQNGVKPALTMVYGNFSDRGRQKNKAN
jgi:hypothetical protein